MEPAIILPSAFPNFIQEVSVVLLKDQGISRALQENVGIAIYAVLIPRATLSVFPIGLFKFVSFEIVFSTLWNRIVVMGDCKLSILVECLYDVIKSDMNIAPIVLRIKVNCIVPIL